MSNSAATGRRQVLVVEDSIEEVFLMRSFLEKGGQYQVTTAQDGDAAARLIKAAFTFNGGLDYAVAKIERHSGVKIALTEKEKRTPLLTGIRLFFKVRKRGGLN